MNEILDFLKLDIFIAQPQTFICLLFCFSFLDPQPNKLFKRIAIISVIHSIYTDVLIFFLPLSLHLVNTLSMGALLLFLIFREISNKKKLYIFILWVAIGVVMDLISSSLMIFITGSVSHAELIREKVFELMAIVYPELLVMLIISWFIRNRNSFSAKKLFSIVMNDDRKSLTNVIVLICFQFCLLGCMYLILSTSDHYNRTLNGGLIIATIFVSLLALVSIIRLLIRTREQAAKMTQEVYVEEINDMFTSIRGQRHDFLNHVQVIHTMVQMGKTEQLSNYVNDLVKETHSVNEIVHHSSPALAAFAQAKTTIAIGKGIAFTCDLPGNWNVQETTVKVIDIIKIIGNLVDNAFDEISTLPPEHRQVHASIQIVEENQIELLVSNLGQAILEEDRVRIFDPGYTSKGEGHSGLGLAIVQERVKHYKGSLELKYDNSNNQSLGKTVFRILLPQASL